MSKGIRFDSLLVRHLADELRARLAGRVVRRIHIDSARRILSLETERDSLLWDLHPQRGWVAFGTAPAPGLGIGLPRRSTVAAVEALPDERLLRFRVRARAGDTTVVVELMTNQRNALVLDDQGRIGTLLWRRDAGHRRLQPGATYEPPAARPRSGTESPLTLDRWIALLAPLEPAERARGLIAAVAFTSPLNASWILGRAGREDDSSALEAAHARYLELAPPSRCRPVALPGDPPQPYPHPLGSRAIPCDSLLAAMQVAADSAGTASPTRVETEWTERIRGRVLRARRRIDRLEEEVTDAAPGAAHLRRSADLLLAQTHAVPRGSTRARLSDFEGGELEIELDPALDAVGNARHLYAEAKRRERAAERIPELLRQARAEYDRLRASLDAAERGELSASELQLIAGPARGGARPSASASSLPYRRYRTTGGLEVRVGRNRGANDELTFHHSAPDDIWLHARDVAGSHVVLRWGRKDANPPARDLAEAAALAALRSRARTSGTVAVDWTRRKYVRKPRKAPPGRVALERARTLFVEPDPALERRLRVPGEERL